MGRYVDLYIETMTELHGPIDLYSGDLTGLAEVEKICEDAQKLHRQGVVHKTGGLALPSLSDFMRLYNIPEHRPKIPRDKYQELVNQLYTAFVNGYNGLPL